MQDGPQHPAPPLPVGFGVRLDPTTRRAGAGALLLGGRPTRLVRLSDAGRRRLDRLLEAGVADGVDGRLARRLIDAGLAHPVAAPLPFPPSATGEVSVVVPVRDRAGELDRCLAALGMGGSVLVVDDGSRHAALVARVVDRHAARLVRRGKPGGPAVARNCGMAELAADPRLSQTFVAFVDSDTEVTPGWLETLLGHFHDPAVGAVAPRVRSTVPTWDPSCGARPAAVARFNAARSPLDLGPHPAGVRPGGVVGHLPTAALVVRRAALDDLDGAPFDPALRYGEDVDLVWRLHDAGWRIRYEPAVTVGHREPAALAAALRRRFAYGSSAGPLAARHPGWLSPLRLRPWPALATGLAVAGRPMLAAAVAGGFAGHVVARLSDRSGGVPARESLRLAGLALAGTARSLGRGAAQLALPVTAATAVLNRHHRLPLLSLLALDPLAAWWERRPDLDPVRWALLSVADDAAYGAGVWRGALRARRAEPVLPRLRPPGPG